MSDSGDPKQDKRREEEAERDYYSASADADRQTPNTQELELDEILTILRGSVKGEWSRETIAEKERVKKAHQILKLIEQNYILKSKVLAAIPKSYKHSVGLDVALLWDSQDATDGFNSAIDQIKEALGLGEVQG